MWQEFLALGSNWGGPPWTSHFAVQLNAQLLFQRNEAIADALLRDPKTLGRRTNLPGARQFYKRRHLIGTDMRKIFHSGKIQ